MRNNKKNIRVLKKNKTTYKIPIPFYKKNYPLYFCLCLVSSIVLLILLGIVVEFIGDFIKKISKLDAVIIVALITGFFTILTEIVSKIITKEQEKNFFLLQKREFIYKQLIEVYFLIQEHFLNNEIINNEEIYQISKTFQNDLILWAPNRVIYSWSNFYKHIDDKENVLINIEEVVFAIRKDITNINLEKGTLLSIGKPGYGIEEK